ncbi:hypothetical protein AB0L56_20935 [Streptomyces sp. NPDC052079]|uniref:hypothetical protein n=1 Tax=Streptomyces sp. NPDC052079 TaxID=3155526 RepID=UPI003416DE7F
MAEHRKRSEALAVMAPEREHVAPRHAVAPGDAGDHVEQVYRYLQRFGSFPNSDLAAHYHVWSGWESLGGGLTDPVVASNADGRLEAFVRGLDGALWHIWQTTPNGGWSGWASLGGGITDPVVGHNADGRMEVFVRGLDGALWHIWQTAPSSGWSGWESLGGGITDPVVGHNADGRMEVFVRGLDGALWHIWQTAPNNGWF